MADLVNPTRTRAANSWLAAGGLLGAILASSCCVLPLVLVTIGLTGAWIGNLAALQPYQPIFAAFALLCLGFGFWQVYFRRADCVDAVRPRSRITKTILWLAALLTLIALTTNWWAPLFY